MIEFDVLPEDLDDPRTSRLLLAHDYDARAAPARRRSRRGSRTWRPTPFAGVELDVDLKLPGYEDARARARCASATWSRARSSRRMFMRSLVALRELEPRLRLGWSVPRVRRDYTRSRLTTLPAYALLVRCGRAAARDRAPRHVRAGRCRRGDGALAPRHAAARARARHGAGGELYVWTVDDARADPRARGAGRRPA